MGWGRRKEDTVLSGASQFLEIAEDTARSMPLIFDIPNPDPKLHYPSHP